MTTQEQNYLQSIEFLGEQIKQAYREAKLIKLPHGYNQANKILVCGMGGSQLGVDVIRHLFSQEISLPIIQIRGYKLPKFADNKTLVFLLSYSGGTEEVLSVAREAISRKTKIIIVSAGGGLKKFAEKYQVPSYIFNPVNNPASQPRMGTGYMIGAVVRFLENLRLLKINSYQVDKMSAYLSAHYYKYCDLKFISRLSQKLKGKIPAIVTSEFLQGNAHVMSNQINESAKQFALYYAIPEINHHLMEGLTYPKEIKKMLYFLFFNSSLYLARNQKRHLVTQQVLTRQKISYTQINLSGDKISQAMEMLVLGSLLSYQLAKVNQVDPNKIPWVNFFKSQMR